jgi:hypothetical protein
LGGGRDGVGGVEGELSGIVDYGGVSIVDDLEGVVAALDEGGGGCPEVEAGVLDAC